MKWLAAVRFNQAVHFLTAPTLQCQDGPSLKISHTHLQSIPLFYDTYDAAQVGSGERLRTLRILASEQGLFAFNRRWADGAKEPPDAMSLSSPRKAYQPLTSGQ
jgi:hypothetical protein